MIKSEAFLLFIYLLWFDDGSVIKLLFFIHLNIIIKKILFLINPLHNNRIIHNIALRAFSLVRLTLLACRSIDKLGQRANPSSIEGQWNHQHHLDFQMTNSPTRNWIPELVLSRSGQSSHIFHNTVYSSSIH